MIKDPACEVHGKASEIRVTNGVLEEGTSLPLDLDSNDIVKADEETSNYAVANWNDSGQRESLRTCNCIYLSQCRHSRVIEKDPRMQG